MIAEEKLHIAEEELHTLRKKLVELKEDQTLYNSFGSIIDCEKKEIIKDAIVAGVSIDRIIKNFKNSQKTISAAIQALIEDIEKAENDQKRISADIAALKEDIKKAEADFRSPYKESFFKPYQSVYDQIIREATIVTAPIALTLLIIDIFVESVIVGLKYSYQSEEPIDQPLRAVAITLVVPLMMFLLAICSPVLNTVDLIGAAFADAAPTLQP